MTDSIEQLAAHYGIADSYLDYRGELRLVSAQSQAAILAAMGVDATDERSVMLSLQRVQTLGWTRLVPPSLVSTVGEVPILPVAVPLELQARNVIWTLQLEQGGTRSGRA